MDLCKKINKRFKTAIKAFVDAKEFSLKLSFLKLFNILLPSKKFSKKIEDFIYLYLKKFYSPILEKNNQNNFLGNKVKNGTIWVCWWSGFDSAPDIVKQCIRSIYKNAGNHKVCLVTSENVEDYIQIPQFILEKVNDKSMCLAHFSDYLRLSLLKQYGGLWIDATIFFI